MKNSFFLLLIGAFTFSGCTGLLPYKTEFDCAKAPGGHCGSLSGNIKEAYEIAGLTSSSDCGEGNVSYEINEVTFEIKKTSPRKRYKRHYKKKKKHRKPKRRKKKVCKYVYY